MCATLLSVGLHCMTGAMQGSWWEKLWKFFCTRFATNIPSHHSRYQIVKGCKHTKNVGNPKDQDTGIVAKGNGLSSRNVLLKKAFVPPSVPLPNLFLQRDLWQHAMRDLQPCPVECVVKILVAHFVASPMRQHIKKAIEHNKKRKMYVKWILRLTFDVFSGAWLCLQRSKDSAPTSE